MFKRKNDVTDLLMGLQKGLLTIVGIVLIWRGIWYALDEIDILLFGSSHILTAIGGVIAGILILYLPDRNIKELEKL